MTSDSPQFDTEGVNQQISSGDQMPSVDEMRRRMYRFTGGFFAFVLVSAVVSGFLFKVPYVALMPGSARDTEPLVMIDGTESYPSDGELLFTTVRLRQGPNFWEYIWYQFDDDIELVEEELILGDKTPDENREINLALMTDSKDLAVAVALEELGFEAIDEVGSVVVEVVEGSAADGVVLRGDFILALDGVPLKSAEELVRALTDHEPGDQVVLRVRRFIETDPADHSATGTTEPETEELDLPITLGAREDDPTVAFMGVAPQTMLDLLASPVDYEIDIDSGSVGGPSAGLAFTLAILDSLTPGDLTGGTDVAVTGTIAADGSVGSVGGVPQKAAAVRELGLKVFIVPLALGEATIDKVIEAAGPDVRVVPVATLSEALEVLQGLGGDLSGIEEFAAGS